MYKGNINKKNKMGRITNVEKFVNYVNNTPELKRHKDGIFLDIKNCGWFGTYPFYQRFDSLFELTSFRNYSAK